MKTTVAPPTADAVSPAAAGWQTTVSLAPAAVSHATIARQTTAAPAPTAVSHATTAVPTTVAPMPNDTSQPKSIYTYIPTVFAIGAAITLLSCFGYLVFQWNRKSIDDDANDDSDDSELDRGMPFSGVFEEMSLQRLLDTDPQADALPVLKSSPSNPELQDEAARVVEEVLSVRDVRTLFGNGTVLEQKCEFRRLVRLLHPDKGYTSGDRAKLALR